MKVPTQFHAVPTRFIDATVHSDAVDTWLTVSAPYIVLHVKKQTSVLAEPALKTTLPAGDRLHKEHVKRVGILPTVRALFDIHATCLQNVAVPPCSACLFSPEAPLSSFVVAESVGEGVSLGAVGIKGEGVRGVLVGDGFGVCS